METEKADRPKEDTVKPDTSIPMPPSKPSPTQEQPAKAATAAKAAQEEAFKPTFRIEFVKDIQALPELDDPKTIDVRYKVIDPFVSIHIYWDDKENELFYEVEEPTLMPVEQKQLAMLQEALTELINFSFINIKDQKTVLEFLEKNLRVLMDEFSIKTSEDAFQKFMYYVYREFVGMGRIEGLTQDYYIEDIECNGFGSAIYIVHRKYRNLRTSATFPDIKELTGFVEKLAQRCSQYISYANPLLDGVLPDGSLDYDEPFIYKEDSIVKISKIGEFIDKFYTAKDSNIPIKVENIEVPAFDPQTLKMTWKKTDYVYRHKINEQLYKLKLEYGRKVTLTGAHSIFKLTKDGVKAEKTCNIKEGDYVAIPLKIPENDCIKECNPAKELSQSKYHRKLSIEGVPQEIIGKRPLESYEYYTNHSRRNVANSYSSMIPLEVFNPLNKTHNSFNNKRISRSRLHQLLNETRFKRFENPGTADSTKFLKEWTVREFLADNELTPKDKELVKELNVVKKLIDSDLGFIKIKEIERVKSTKEFVYDVSVKGCENFVGGHGGICCHNSRVNATYTQDISAHGPTFCFTEGHIQLNDGSVKKIDKFFEECKSRFGSKIEHGNEVVDTFNLNCMGVDENTLKQKDCILKTVIKLKPPEKLVKLELEDGSEISTTINHLFHIADGTLKQIEAKDLKKGMFVPIPKKVNALGCLQKINVSQLIQEFSYSNKVCVKTSQQIKELVNNEICTARGEDGAYRGQLSQKYNVNQSHFYEVINRGSSISFEILDKLCDTQGYNFNDIDDISITVYGGGTKNKSKAVKIPYQVDKELGYLAGAIISDGHLSKAYLDISCYEESSREFVKAYLINKFGKCNSYYNGNRIYLCNLFAPYLFNKVFGIPIGKKSSIVKVPEVIFKSGNEVVSSFIKGLFDGDGTCKSGLSYKTYSKELAEGLTYLLARLGIYSYLKTNETPKNKFEYKVGIPSPYYRRYLEKVGFEDLKKSNHLRELIAKQKDHKTFIRYGRMPSKPIMGLIKKLNLSQNKLSKICKVGYKRFYYDSYSKSFVKNLLKEIKKEKNPDSIKEELDYIEWMLDSGQEFVRIKNVELVKNVEKKHVYDIELKPCKYFIAGNKPMNIFDTIRKFTTDPWTPVKLMDFRTVSPEILAYLWIAIENKSSIMVIGGTGSGKTSFLNAIAFFIPPAARVVSIEDTQELNLRHENWLPSVARAGVGAAMITGERHGEVSLFDLLKESLRQRPDYIIVGEVRGKEAYVLFQGMATGHPSFGTFHAESVETMIKRLETPPILLSPSLIEAMDLACMVAQTKVKGKDVRRLMHITEIVRIGEGDDIVLNIPFVRDPATDKFLFKTDSKVLQKIMQRTGMTWQQLLREFELRTRLLMEMYRRKIFGFREVQDIISRYYKVPQEVLKQFGIA